MKEKLEALKEALQEINDLQSASAVLSWDQATYMPPGGAPARGRQMATLQRLAHEKFTDPSIGKLLDELEPYGESLSYDSDDAALLRVTRYDYDRLVRVPASLVAELASHGAAAYEAWVAARPANDFAGVAPYLEKMVDLSRQLANCFPGYDHIADPLIEFSDYGMTVATITPLFERLREELVPLVKAVTEQADVDTSFLFKSYPEEKQLDFGLRVIERFGYDLRRGRQDKTAHPFATKFSIGDVRITTRVNENDATDALFSTMHESGHAMYEQGSDPAFEGLPLDGGTSAGVHESQSRLWENLVGRSRPFWNYFYPQLQEQFPEQLGSVPMQDFYRAINRVERSLIRTDADELTYNLHVIIRFQLEQALLEGRLSVQELPEAWRAAYESDIGLAAPDDRDGVLQDVHWFAGPVGGAFQGYTLGNILSAQFFEAATQSVPEVQSDMERGEFSGLHGWLRENVYRHGRKFTAPELIERATGSAMTVDPYLRYLRAKYGELYSL